MEYDPEVLDTLVQARFTRPGLEEERAYSQLPVACRPRRSSPRRRRSAIVRQLVALADWAGAEGRPLTGTGNLRLADARELAGVLGTGEQDLKVRSSAEMRKVSLLLAWAKGPRLVRVSKGRLLRVAKAAALLRDPEALWSRAFEVFFDLGDAVAAPASTWMDSSMLVKDFDELLPDVLNSVYGMSSPVPVVRLQETVWLACQDHFFFKPDAVKEEVWRRQTDRDLVAALEVLSELGAVELSHGMADELYSSEYEHDIAVEHFDGEHPLPPAVRARLLTHLAEPGALVQLTPLGLRAVRERMLADGRDVPLVGELVDAPPGELLGVLAER
ncbi:hypothetical protein N5079_14580 [Planotetraspora sp. A-T 1434]|uniref:hypothetical protein n=1 Tax=Planotetraspora sp. A-T 1434 TaxID=2979219 RepID=UPI0021C06779|nr:hypothetical protein [Planotetraspora sp. A-T 1434]MCT9931444.1 hypothetical protein [Planotetraspora sp. A-T 1434]